VKIIITGHYSKDQDQVSINNQTAPQQDYMINSLCTMVIQTFTDNVKSGTNGFTNYMKTADVYVGGTQLQCKTASVNQGSGASKMEKVNSCLIICLSFTNFMLFFINK
jgi:hypothetical protein